jgi:hypothetical protein
VAAPLPLVSKLCLTRIPFLQAANEKFRSLQRVYSILGDEEKRCARSLRAAASEPHPHVCSPRVRRVQEGVRRHGRRGAFLAVPMRAVCPLVCLTSRQQDALTGEQFDSLYRYYRNVYAKVRPIAAPVDAC